MAKTQTIKINKIHLSQKYDPAILSVTGASFSALPSHKKIAQKLKNKNPHTITVIIDRLNSRFWNNKKYVEKIKIPIEPLYKELLYKYFFEEFGNKEGNELGARDANKINFRSFKMR